MYKSRFKRWGLWKYTRAADVAQVLKAKAQHGLDTQPAEVYLNGKRVDFNRIEKYLRRRGTVRRGSEFGILYLQKTTASDDVVLKMPPREGEELSSTTSVVLPLSPPAELRITESTFRAVRDYYDGCLSANRWFFEAPTNSRVFLATPNGSLVDGTKRLNEFHQRFKLALSHLATPDTTGSEGVKMTRVCFAELPDVLAGEDPTLLYCILDIVRRLRELNMDSLARQLLQHLDVLAAASASPASFPYAHGRNRNATGAIWHNLLDGLATLDAPQTMQCARIVTDRLSTHLGPQHMKALEADLWATFLSDADTDAREARLRSMAAAVNALPGGVFDYRHLFVNCDLANLLRKRGKLAEAAGILAATLDVPERMQVLRQHPPIAYNYLSLLGKIRITESKLAEAEGLFRDAIAIAKTVRDEDDSDLLDGLFFLEQALRGQGRHGEADGALEERNAIIRESLERVGEKEDSVS